MSANFSPTIRFNQTRHVWSDSVDREDKDPEDDRLDFTVDEDDFWSEEDDLENMF